MQHELTLLLKSHWGNYFLDSFENFKNLNILKGEEGTEFVHNLTPKLITLLRKRFILSQISIDLVIFLKRSKMLLSLWS